MSFESNVGGRDRLVRAVLAVLLAVVAVRARRHGKRTTGLLAGLGALGFGFNAVTCFCGLNRLLVVDTTDE
jgi:threonine dehydrogenase-like Zn-dependent dehydrogenase